MLTKNSNLFKHFGFVEMLRNKYRFLIRLFLTQILIQTYLTNEIFNFSNENFVRILVRFDDQNSEPGILGPDMDHRKTKCPGHSRDLPGEWNTGNLDAVRQWTGPKS